MNGQVEAAGRGPALVVSHDLVGRRMAGPGIRYHHLARVLSRHLPVTLAMPAGSEVVPGAGYATLIYQAADDQGLLEAIAGARCVFASAIWIARCPALLSGATPVAVDGYDPFHAEVLFLTEDETGGYLELLTRAYLAGDYFVCASERQRDWWLGTLEAVGRVNIHTYRDDAALRRLVDLVPFGLPEEPPSPGGPVFRGIVPGIGDDARIVLWGGGLWPWLDPLTAVEAMALIVGRRPEARLVFPGTRHPNSAMEAIPTHAEAAKARAAELGLEGRVLFFDGWMDYADWPAALLESDVALSLHCRDTLESRLAFRSRVLDYVWAGLPVVATAGDVTSELVAQRDLGLVVPPGDRDAVAAAILRLLDEPRSMRADQFRRARADLTWERAAQPLLEFCRHPWRAPDRLALGDRLGNSHYLQQLAHCEWRFGKAAKYGQEQAERAAGLLAETERLNARVAALEARRAVRFANWLAAVRASVGSLVRGGH